MVIDSHGRQHFLGSMLWWVVFCTGSPISHAAGDAPITNQILVLEIQGTAEISPAGATTWVPTQTNALLHPADRLRTGPNSRVSLLWFDQTVVPFGALTEVEILPPHAADAESGLQLIRGILSFFHRDKPGRIRVITRGAFAGVEGTEFAVSVDTVGDTERTTISVIDGIIQFTNDYGGLALTNGQQAIAELGKAPVPAPGFVVNHVLQWAFYYPAVLDLADLPLAPQEQNLLSDSLTAYREGDLLTALAKYPAAGRPGSEAEQLYYAALLLSVGQVTQAEPALAALSGTGPPTRLGRLATALRQLIAVVKRDPNPPALRPELPTEFLAASYYEQSAGTREAALRSALALATQAATNSAHFGFAWARVAELEFGFGRNARAEEALQKSLALAPRDAQALALKGFLLAAENRAREAIAWFGRALAVDSALGNAWLGRGLCRIRLGDLTGGRQDLLVAAALEPQRSMLRSYLGKAYEQGGDAKRASKELQLAKELDPNDPTAWLYSALLEQSENRINQAVRDLEESQALNENRSVYRSRLLLDQDRAVRSANLAAVYRDADLFDLSVREASRGVSYDYANYSAHLFLATSYDQLRDPNRVNLRYATPAENEYLIANLLAPVGAGTLSQTLSQQDYGRLFERDGFGLSSSTEYLSRGAWTERGAQYGIFGNASYAFEAFYRSDPGQRPNNDLEETELHLDLKQQITPDDAVYFRGIYYDAEGGDLFQYFDPARANPVFRYHEKQEPMLFLGYHHQWSPGSHTLFLAGRFDDTYEFNDPMELILIKAVNGGQLTAVLPINMDQAYRDTLEIYSAELQQVWQTPVHSTVVGALGQWGRFQVMNLQTATDFPDLFNEPAADQKFALDFRRASVYGYHQWQIVDPLSLVAGLSYDYLSFPENFRFAPISNREESTSQVSPKAGLVWTPVKDVVVRAAYTRSLGGASLDQSFRLEPTQVAGFNQAFRSIIPESVAGANAGARFETFGLSLENKFPTRTYVGLTGEILKSSVHRTVGAFELNTDVSDFAFPSDLGQHLDFEERSILFTVDQLLGQEWSLGARYRLTDARLTDSYPGVPATASTAPPFEPQQHLEAVLHQLNLHLTYNHRCGFFAQFQALWNLQSNQGYQPDLPGDEFWHLNAVAGYRFLQRRAELSLGVLNLTDQDYRLNALTLYNELPRHRTLAARFQLSF